MSNVSPSRVFRGNRNVGTVVHTTFGAVYVVFLFPSGYLSLFLAQIFFQTAILMVYCINFSISVHLES